MKVFALGGAGQFGKAVARKLIAADIVSEIVIAGRNLEAARSTAIELGVKASAVQVDLFDERQLASLAEGYDVMVNTAGPERMVVLPALRAAIKAGVNYCDICANGPTTERALDLDAAAKKAGMTALMGIGEDPGLSNLLMMHAAHQLDQVEDLRFCIFFVVGLYGAGPKRVLAEMRKSGRSDANWQNIMSLAGPRVRLYRNGHWLDVNPVEDAVCVELPQGYKVTAYPIGVSEPITVPRALPNVRSVSVLASLHPPELNELWCELGARVDRGELDESAAAVKLYEYMASQPERSIAAPKGYELGWIVWADAVGVRRNRRMRYRCWPDGDWFSTVGPVTVAALKLLRGEIRNKGVLSPESCLDPMPFFSEVAGHATAKPRNGKLLNESFEELTQ